MMRRISSSSQSMFGTSILVGNPGVPGAGVPKRAPGVRDGEGGLRRAVSGGGCDRHGSPRRGAPHPPCRKRRRA
jgi:hypothetical protein